MSATFLAEMYDLIQHANPLIPVIALGIYKAEKAGDLDGANERRARCLDNHGIEFVNALDTCLLYFRLYGIPGGGDAQR